MNRKPASLKCGKYRTPLRANAIIALAGRATPSHRILAHSLAFSYRSRTLEVLPHLPLGQSDAGFQHPTNRNRETELDHEDSRVSSQGTAASIRGVRASWRGGPDSGTGGGNSARSGRTGHRQSADPRWGSRQGRRCQAGRISPGGPRSSIHYPGDAAGDTSNRTPGPTRQAGAGGSCQQHRA